MKIYDLAVIGAGSGGLGAALTANRRGLKVAMIEKTKLVGNVPMPVVFPAKHSLAALVFTMPE